MKFLKQVLQSTIATVVIMAIVGFLMLTNVVPYNSELFLKFLIGAILLIFGKSLFLSAVDTSILPLGKAVGSELMKRKSVLIIIFFGFLFGFVSTVAEPDVQVMVSQITSISPFLSSFLLLSIISIGCGLLVCLGLYRIIRGIGLKWIMLGAYTLILVLMFFCPTSFIGISLDGGGATTGAVAVPFLLSLTFGICALRGKDSKSDSFGIVALTSTGPVIALLIFGIICGEPTGSYVYAIEELTFGQIFLNQCWEVFLAFLPLVATFIITQFTIIKFPIKQFFKVLVGFVVACLGLVLFLTGIYYGFNEMADYFGKLLALNGSNLLILAVGFIMGFAIVYAEPAISVLSEQVEEVTTGFMQKKVIYFALGIGVGLAIMFAFLVILYQISILWFIMPLYVIMLILNFVIPKIFIGIAFDGGGTAPGTMLVAFILPICFGMCETLNINILLYGFGIVGLVATVPVIVLQLIGLIYKIKKRRIEQKEKLKEDKNE